MRALRWVVEAGAAVGVAVFVDRWVFNLPGMSVRPPGHLQPNSVPVLCAIALIAVAVAILLRPRRLGWALAAVAPVVAALTLPDSLLPPGLNRDTTWALAIAAGVTLGGLALAAAHADRAGRTAIAGGLAAGLLARQPLLGLLWPADPGNAQAQLAAIRWYLLGTALVIAIAALLALLDRRSAATPEPRGFGFVVVTAIGGGLLVLGHRLVNRPRPWADGVPQHDPYPWLGVALAIGAVFAWYAYRRGGADAARWVVLALGLAAPLALSEFSRADFNSPAQPLVLAGLAAIAGAALTVFADRAAPWDAVGVLAAAVGWLLSAPNLLHRGYEPLLEPSFLVVGGAAFALAAGTSRLWRSNVDRPAAHTALGLALIVLAASALAPPVVFEESRGPSWGLQSPIPVPALGLLCAIALTALFFTRTKTARESQLPGSPASMG